MDKICQVGTSLMQSATGVVRLKLSNIASKGVK